MSIASAERSIIIARDAANGMAADLGLKIDYGFAHERKFHVHTLPSSNVKGNYVRYLEFDSIHEIKGYLAALQHVRDGMVKISKTPTSRRAKKPTRKTKRGP
jgi:hypothetical protein